MTDTLTTGHLANVGNKNTFHEVTHSNVLGLGGPGICHKMSKLQGNLVHTSSSGQASCSPIREAYVIAVDCMQQFENLFQGEMDKDRKMLLPQWGSRLDTRLGNYHILSAHNHA
ncbi:hypothetical protein A6R68_09444, partial [Neotoma lepida]